MKLSAQSIAATDARSGLPFSRDSFPRLLFPWILRDDGDTLLLYKCVTSELKYRVLSPVQALILPFFSGERSLAEIRSIWLHLMKPAEKDESLQFLDDLVRNLTTPDKVIGAKGTPSPSLTNKSGIPLPDFSRYRWPAERTSVPVSVLVSLTNRCVADCRYCYAERNPCKELTCSEWNEVFDKLAELSIRLVDMSGADPFARDDVFDLLRAMVQRDFLFLVSTKSHISLKSARRLADLGIGRRETRMGERGFQVSVDSVSNEVASWLTGVRNYLDRAKSTVTHLVAAGLDPRIKCVLTPYNWNEAGQIVDTFSRLGARRFHFVQYGRSLYRHSDDLFLTREQKLRLHDSFPRLVAKRDDLEIMFQDGTDEVTTAEQSKRAWEQRAVCTGGRAALVILPNGDVTLCEQLPHTPEHVVGNLLRQSLLEIWNGTVLDVFLHPGRSKFEGTSCFSCSEFEECHSGRGYCYREALTAFGSVYDAPPGCPRQQKIPLRII